MNLAELIERFDLKIFSDGTRSARTIGAAMPATFSAT